MPAKSFLGETREAAHRFYAMTIRGDVSDENIQACMRAASQIQEIWLQIDERIAALQVQGTPIWLECICSIRLFPGFYPICTCLPGLCAGTPLCRYRLRSTNSRISPSHYL